MNKSPKWLQVGIPLLIIASWVFYETVLSPRGATTLSWTAPTEYENDQPIDDLAGYIVHCWTDTGKFTMTVYVDDPSVTSYSIEKLRPGTYFCAVTAFNEKGDESTLSNVVTNTVY